MAERNEGSFPPMFFPKTLVRKVRLLNRDNDVEKFEITILGCGSATPTLRHNPSAQVINMRDKLSLVDCGEGTQIQLRLRKVRFMALRNVFISHLHGDHCLGLIGLISSFGLLGRTRNFHVYADAQLQPLLDAQLKMFCHKLDFEVVFHPVDTTQHAMIYEDRTMEVWTLPLSHRTECCGYLFREKPGRRHINRAMTDFYEIPPYRLNDIKDGQDWTTPDGRVIANERLTTPATPSRSYAYCSDTMFMPLLAQLVSGVDLLYHEATYADEQMAKAQARGHSTASQAAEIARMAGVRKLMIGHYSATVSDVGILLAQARNVFDNTIAADEGLVVNV